MFLLVNNDQYVVLQSINDVHEDRKIMPVKSNNNNWIVQDDLLTDCTSEGTTWYDWKDWLASLSPTDDTPAPRPPRKTPTPDPAP
jgi:hypothetical protein